MRQGVQCLALRILAHLLGQGLDEVRAEQRSVNEEAWMSRKDPPQGVVALRLDTFENGKCMITLEVVVLDTTRSEQKADSGHCQQLMFKNLELSDSPR